MIRFLGSVTGDAGTMHFLRIDRFADFCRVYPRARGDLHNFVPGLFLISDFGAVGLSRKCGAEMVDLMRRDGLRVPGRIVRAFSLPKVEVR